MSGAFQHLTLQPIPPPVPACAQTPGSSHRALGAEQSQTLGLVFPLPQTHSQATKGLEVPMSQLNDKRSLRACSFPRSTRQHAMLGSLAEATQADHRAGSCSPSGLKFCPSDFFSSIRKPRVPKLVLTQLVGRTMYGPGPKGGCEWVSAPSPGDAGSAACSPLGY